MTQAGNQYMFLIGNEVMMWYYDKVTFWYRIITLTGLFELRFCVSLFYSWKTLFLLKVYVVSLKYKN